MILKKLRQERGYTSKFIYTALGIKQSTFSCYEHGKRRANVKFFIGLQKLYDLNDSEILKVMQLHEEEVEQYEGRTKKTT